MTMDYVVVGVSTAVALILVGATVLMSRMDEIKQNWVQYRCNPVYMPFAGFVGVDPVGNFTRCTMKSFQDYAGFIMDPIQQLFGTFIAMFSSIAESLQNMRAMFNGVRTGFLAIVTQIYGKLANTMSMMQYLMVRIRTVMMRIMAMFAAMVNMLNTGVASGKSVMNGPVGQTINFLCFDPATPVTMKGGIDLPMSQLLVGDVLEDGATVTGVYTLHGLGQVLYDYHGIRVTGSHRLADGRRIDECSDAVPLPGRISTLACLDTDSGRMTIGGHVFRDFEWAFQDWLMALPLGSMVVGRDEAVHVVGLRQRSTGWEVLVTEE